MPQVIGIPKEIFPGESAVAIAPEVVAQKLVGLGFSVLVERARATPPTSTTTP